MLTQAILGKLTFGQEIAKVFTSMQWFVILLLCIGVVLLFVECFIPDFGACGICGIVSLVGGIIAHAIVSKSVVQVLFLIVLFAIVILILILIFIRSARFGLISKSPIVLKQAAVPTDFADKNKNQLTGLIGKLGVTKTSFNPSGKFVIDDVIYEGTTNGEPLDLGDNIKVVDVEGNKIIIQKVEV